MLNTLSRYPFPSPHTYHYHKYVLKSCCTAPKFSKIVFSCSIQIWPVLLPNVDRWYDPIPWIFSFLFMWSLYENVINDRYICLFVIRLPCNWIATAIHKMIKVRAVCKQFHSLCNNTGVWFLDSLTASIDSGLHKVVETFDRSVLNKSVFFVHTSPSCN